MSYINQTFHGNINHLNIENINNITRHENTSDASRQNTYPTKQGNFDFIFKSSCIYV